MQNVATVIWGQDSELSWNGYIKSTYKATVHSWLRKSWHCSSEKKLKFHKEAFCACFQGYTKVCYSLFEICLYIRNNIHLGVGLCPTFVSAESPNAG